VPRYERPYSFKKSPPQLILRKIEDLSTARAKAFSETIGKVLSMKFKTFIIGMK
jgi:hypothetical protein